jgi:hypothetical protein
VVEPFTADWIHFHTHSCGCWEIEVLVVAKLRAQFLLAVSQRLPIVLCQHGPLQHGSLLHQSKLTRAYRREQVQSQFLCTLTSWVMSYHFCCSLFLRSQSPGTAHVRKGSHKACILGSGVIGDSLRYHLSHHALCGRTWQIVDSTGSELTLGKDFSLSGAYLPSSTGWLRFRVANMGELPMPTAYITGRDMVFLGAAFSMGNPPGLALVLHGLY